MMSAPPDLAVDLLLAARATPAGIAARQAVRWQALLSAAAAGSAHYRRVLAGRDPMSTPLAALPPSGKSALMADFASWVTDPALNLDALRRFARDRTRIGEPWLGRYAVWESSGSTGEPALFVQDAQALAVYDALETLRRDTPRPWQRWLDPLLLAERVAFVGAIDGHFASEVTMRRLRGAQPWRAASWRSFSILQPLDALVAQLDAFRPTVIATYPTAAALLAEQARAGRLHARPQECWTGGETLTPAMRAAIEQGLGCTLRHSYGASEFLPIAWECAHGRLHVNADWVILEPVDADGQPTPAGRPSHTTLLTNLANHVQPIIRLDIGDRITWHEAPCRCGCALPTIEVEGRDDEVLSLPGADGRPVPMLPLALVTALEDEAGVSQFRLEQRGPRRWRLHLEPGTDAAAATRCRAVLRDLARTQGAQAPQLQVSTDTPLPVGRSGKRRRVVALAGR